MATLIRLAFLFVSLSYSPDINAQIDFSVLDKYRGLDAQRGKVSGTVRKDNLPKNGNTNLPSQKEIRKENEQARRIVAFIRSKLVQPESPLAVTFSQTLVSVNASGGYLKTPPSPAGVFSGIAAGAAKTHATSISPDALRRTAAILTRATAEGTSNETAAFLASEAINAMEGASLKVHLDEGEVKRSNTKREKNLRALLQEAEENYHVIELAQEQEIRTNVELLNIVKQVGEGTLSEADANAKKKELSDALKIILEHSNEAMEKIRELPKKMKQFDESFVK